MLLFDRFLLVFRISKHVNILYINMQTRRKPYRTHRKTVHRRHKMQGGFLCSSENTKDRYTLGQLIGRGEEGNVYVDIDDHQKVIKKYNPILVINPRHKKQLKDYQRIFKISKRIGDMGIGPRVHYYKICKQVITVDFNDGPSVRSRTAAKFPSGSKELKIIRDPSITEFSYEAYVPYLVMDKIEGREITRAEVDEPQYMELIYLTYLELYKNHIAFRDMHRGNIIVSGGQIFFIDFSSAHVLKKMPKVKSIAELKESILDPSGDEDIYEISPLSESSIDSQISKEFSR